MTHLAESNITAPVCLPWRFLSGRYEEEVEGRYMEISAAAVKLIRKLH